MYACMYGLVSVKLGKKLTVGDHLAAQCVQSHGTITFRLTLTLANAPGNDFSFGFSLVPTSKRAGVKIIKPSKVLCGTAVGADKGLVSR